MDAQTLLATDPGEYWKTLRAGNYTLSGPTWKTRSGATVKTLANPDPSFRWICEGCGNGSPRAFETAGAMSADATRHAESCTATQS